MPAVIIMYVPVCVEVHSSLIMSSVAFWDMSIEAPLLY